MEYISWMRATCAIVFFVLLSSSVFTQICIDGNYCPNPVGGDPAGNCDEPTVTDEWGGVPGYSNASASSSCEFAELYAVVDNGNLNFGVVKGNEGAAHFFIYFDTDCDPTTGDPNYGGADKRLQFRVRQSGNPPLEIIGFRCYDDAAGAFGPNMNGGLGVIASGSSDACMGVDENFVEVSYPILDLFDPCQEGCEGITITTLESRSGWSENSSLCDLQSVMIETFHRDPTV